MAGALVNACVWLMEVGMRILSGLLKLGIADEGKGVFVVDVMGGNEIGRAHV